MAPVPRLVKLAAISIALAAPARAVPAVVQVVDGAPQVIAPQQIIVSCNPDALLSCSNALASIGATILAAGQDVFKLLLLPDGVSLQGALDTLRGTLGIASAEPNRIFLGSTAYPQTWHFPAIAAPGDATLLPGATSPVVAVLDSGVAYETYQDFLGPTYAPAPVFAATPFAPGWDFINGDAHPDDDNGHGTAMATIIAGQGTFSSAAIPYVGPAAGATILPVKVLDGSNTGTEFALAEGIRYAVRSGAQVINLSLDFARNYLPGASLRDAIARARAANVVVIAASGNTGGRVQYPAAFPDVISVGAVRLDATSGYAVPPYSSRGEALDLVGPGGVSDLDVNQDGLWDGVLAQAFPPGSPTQIDWWLFAGTSPAAAHVSAAAAALIGNGVAPATVRPLLQATAARMSCAAWDPVSGSGRVQARSAIAQASAYVPPSPLYADVVAALRGDGRAAGAVMVTDGNGTGVSNVEVHARWRGAAPASQTAVTDGSGVARFVSPAPTTSRKLFLLEASRLVRNGVPQRPRPVARATGGFNSLFLTLNLSGLLGGTTTTSSTDGLGLWGYGFSEAVGVASGTTGSGVASGTTGSGVASGTTGSGVASGTTGSTGTGASTAPYPLSTGIAGCPVSLPLHSYNAFSFTVSQAFFSGASLASGYSVRTLDSSWVLAPGAAAMDGQELAYICGTSALTARSLSSSYFSSGTLYFGGSAWAPAGMGAGDNPRFWAEVLNAELASLP